jgi:hypothetical protein
MTSTGTLQVRAGGVTVFDLRLTNAALLVFSGGVAARLGVGFISGPAASLGFTAAMGSFTFEVFTAAGGQVTIPGTAQPIQAGVRVITTGNLTMAGFTLNATFTFAASASNIAVSGSVNTALSVGGTQVMALTGSAAMLVTGQGIAGRFSLTVAAGGGVPATLGFTLTGTFTFEVNTTRTVVATVFPLLPDRLNPSDASPNAWARIAIANGNLGILGITFAGSMAFAVSSGELRLQVNNAAGSMAVGGNTVAQGTANASFVVRSDGIAGKVALTAPAAVAGVLQFGWAAGTTFEAEFNTSRREVDVPFAGRSATIAAGPFAGITASGGVVAQNLTLTGTFAMSVSGTEIAVAGTNLQASLMAGNQAVFVLGPISAAMGIRSTGFVAQLAMNVSAGPSSGVFGFSLSGLSGLRLEINTTNQQVTSIAGLTISPTMEAGRYARVVAFANLNIGSFTAFGTLTFTAGASTVALTGSVDTHLVAGGVTVLGLRGTTNWVIASNGVAGKTTMAVITGMGVPSGLGFTLTGSYSLEVNTTRTTVSTLGGLTFNPSLPDRLNPTDTSTNAWAKIAVTNGVLGISGIFVSGSMELAVSSAAEIRMRVINAIARIAVNATNATNGVTVAQATANATFLILSSGIAGKVSLTSASQTGTGLGFSWQSGTTFELEFKTMTGNVTVPLGSGTTTLSGNPYALVRASGGVVTQGLTVTGTFALSVSGTRVDFAATSVQVDLAPGGVRVIRVTASSAALSVSTSGLVAMIAVSLGNGPSTPGLTMSAMSNLRIEINTTNASVTSVAGLAISPTLPAGIYARINADATVTLGGMNLVGNFKFSAGTQTINSVSQAAVSMVADATLQLRAGATTVFDLDVNASLLAFSGGVAARFAVSHLAGPASLLDLDMQSGMTFQFEVNTSASGVTIPGSAVSIASGVRVIASGTFKLDNGFELNGSFTFSTGTRSINGTSQSVMLMAADATLRIMAGDYRVFALDTEGTLVIFSSGVAARFSVDRILGPSSTLGFGAASGMTFTLEVNTSTSSVSVNSASSIAPGIRVVANGSITVSGFSISGTFTFIFTSSYISVSSDATFSFLGATLNVDGAVQIYGGSDPGIAMNILLTKGSDTTPNITEAIGFDITGSMALQLNSRDTTTLSAPGNTFRVRVTSASVTISSFTLTGSANFSLSSGVFRADVSLSGSLWGYTTATFSGYLRSDGVFSVTATKSVNLSSAGNGFVGTLVVRLSRTSSGFSFFGDADGNLSVFGVTLASFDGWVTSTGKVKFTISIAGFSGTIGFDLANNGSFFDGPVAGATVFFDANLNMLLDEGEPFTTTDDLGNYRLDVPFETFDLNGNGIFDANEGQIVGIGGIDTFTGLPVTVPMVAPADALGTGVPTLLSPVSTLLSSLLATGLTRAEAEAVLGRIAGLDAATLGLLSVRDLSEDLATGSEDAFEFFRLGAELQTAATLLASLFKGAGGFAPGDVAGAFYDELASRLTGNGNPTVDSILGTARNVEDVVAAVAGSLGVNLSDALVGGAAAVIASLHDEIDSVGFDAASLAEVARRQIVGQGDAAAALGDAGAGTTPIATVVNAFTGAGLVAAISETPPPDISLPPPEPPPPPEVVVTPLPDGTQKIVYTPSSPELILDENGEPVLDPTFFQFTVPVIGDNSLRVSRIVIEAERGTEGPQFIEVRTSIDGFASVVARIDTFSGLHTYVIDLLLPESTAPVTVQLKAVEPAPVVEPGEDEEPVTRDEGFQFLFVQAEGILKSFHTTPRLADHLASRGASPVAISKVPQDKYLPVTPGEHGKALGKDKKLEDAIDPSISAAPPLEDPPPPPSVAKGKPKK